MASPVVTGPLELLFAASVWVATASSANACILPPIIEKTIKITAKETAITPLFKCFLYDSLFFILITPHLCSIFSLLNLYMYIFHLYQLSPVILSSFNISSNILISVACIHVHGRQQHPVRYLIHT